MYAIETLNLTKKYKNQRGAENMSLTIEQGEIFGLLGPNGCGKTHSPCFIVATPKVRSERLWKNHYHENACRINSCRQRRVQNI